MLSPRSFLTPVAVCVAIVSANLAHAADGKLTGRINIKGMPLAAGRIIFHLEDGQFVGARVKDGAYTIDRVPTGTRKITVEGKGVAPKFAFEDTSGLTLEVKQGTATHDIVLP